VISDTIVKLSKDSFNPLINLEAAVQYEKVGQTAAAVGFYLRAAEYGYDSNPLVTYTALLKITECFEKQGERISSVQNTLLQAIEYLPNRPEAYFMLSRYHERTKEWQESHTWASIGLYYTEIKQQPLFTETEYLDEYCLVFQKAVSAWWIGRRQESIELFTYLDSLHMAPMYKEAVKNNLKLFTEVSKPNEMVYASNDIGTFLIPNIDSDEIVATIKNGLVYDKPIIDEFTYIKPDSIAIDLGANFGQMSIAMSKLCSKVYAVEADPGMVEILSKNLKINNVDNYEIIPRAAWDVSGINLPFPEPDLVRFASLGSYGVSPESKTDRLVESIAIDDLGLENVSLIKSDIQGADLKALQGAKETILRCKPAIIFEHEPIFDEEFGTSFKDYEEFIDSIQYKIEKVVSPNNYLILPKEFNV